MKNLNKTKTFSAVKSLNKTHKNTKNIQGFDDEDDEGQVGTLGFFTKEIVNYEVTVPLDEVVNKPSYYRHVAEKISGLSKGDLVKFKINSPGGSMYGMFSLLSALEETEASSMAILEGEVASAASIIALNCDTVIVASNATMMIHNISFGSNGKMSDVQRHVEFTKRQSERLIDSTYEGFLSPEEIKDVHKGLEIWLDADEILVRLEARQAYFEEKYKDEHTEDYSELDTAEKNKSTEQEYVVPS